MPLWFQMRKQCFSLYPHFCNVKEALAMFENTCKQLKKHIYTVHMQWNDMFKQERILNC